MPAYIVQVELSSHAQSDYDLLDEIMIKDGFLKFIQTRDKKETVHLLRGMYYRVVTKVWLQEEVDIVKESVSKQRVPFTVVVINVAHGMASESEKKFMHDIAFFSKSEVD